MTPIVLGAGRTLFDGVKHKLSFKRVSVKNFENGNIFAIYEPAG